MVLWYDMLFCFIDKSSYQDTGYISKFKLKHEKMLRGNVLTKRVGG